MITYKFKLYRNEKNSILTAKADGQELFDHDTPCLDEPTTYWIYDSEGRREWNNVTDEPLSFAVFPSADADAEFIESCQVHGINPIHHYYAIASYLA